MVQVDPLARAMRYQPDEESCWMIPVCLNYNRLTATIVGVLITILLVCFILTIVLLFPNSPSYTIKSIILSEFQSKNDYLRINMSMEVEVENPNTPDMSVLSYEIRLRYDETNTVIGRWDIPKENVSGTKHFSYRLIIDSDEDEINEATLFEISREYRRKDFILCTFLGSFNIEFMFIRIGGDISIPIVLTDNLDVYQNQDQTTSS